MGVTYSFLSLNLADFISSFSFLRASSLFPSAHVDLYLEFHVVRGRGRRACWCVYDVHNAGGRGPCRGDVSIPTSPHPLPLSLSTTVSAHSL